MNASLTLRMATGIAVASLLASPLAGCSGNTQALPGVPAAPDTHVTVPAAAGAMGSAAMPDGKKKKTQLLFVSDNEHNSISVYDAASKTQNPPVLRKITNGLNLPNGIAVDKSGNLYVANYGTNTVTVYAPNASSPKMTLSSGLNGPWDVKVDGFGNVYVANVPLYGGTDFITKFDSGSSSPSATWYVPVQGMTISGLALLDPTVQGETSVYALAYTLNGSDFATGYSLSCYPGNYTCVSFGTTFGQTGGIAVAESPGNAKPFQWLAVDQYIPGVDIFTQNQSETSFTTGGTPEFLTLNSSGKDLFVADRFYGRVVEYSYPSKTQINSFSTGGQTYGVATYPSGSLH
jgi:hypothetical protein